MTTDTAMTLQDPSTGEAIGAWSESSPEEIQSAVDAARLAFPYLAQLSRWERCDLLLKTGEAMASRFDLIVSDLILEHGKIRQEAEAEVHTAIHSFEMNAEYARRLDGAIPEVSDPRKRVFVRRIPLGVLAIITPWNFPVNIPVEYLGPALAMGNAVVWKGAESTPRSTRHIVECIEQAGWPKGAVSQLVGGPRTGAELVRNDALEAVGFTGSSDVGREIAGVGGMRKLLLEMGGNGPSVVFPDANLEWAAERIVSAASFCSGQACSATERVFVHREVYREFVEAVDTAASAKRVGPPDDPGAAFGPLHLNQTGDTMSRHVQEAVSRGAKLVAGGQPESSYPTNLYWPLTVLSEVRPDSLVFAEETFGPIVPVASFDDESDLLERVDASPYGLAGSIFTRDLERAFRMAELMKCGTVIVNDHSNTWETHIPFGGHPDTSSGIGRVGGPYAMNELSTVKTIALDVGI